MPNTRKENRLIAATKTLWLGLQEAPGSLWVASISVLVVGGGLILVAKIPSPFGWERHEPAELARDVGIALIIAPIVTIIYEAATRRSAKLEEMTDLLNVTMRSFVTEDIWQEIKEQIVRRNRTRRNIEIIVKVLREVELASGLTQSVPADMAVLEIEYAYDLHRLTAEGQNVEVRHAVDIHMWDEAFRVPRFNWIDVTVARGETTRYEKEELGRLYNRTKGLFSVEVELPEGHSAHVVSNRYEKIFLPGMYTLFMPEILTRDDEAKPDSTTISLTIEDLPEDLEATCTTWYAPHELERGEKSNQWIFNRPMLPGQGIGLIFTKRVAPAKSETTNSVAASAVATTSGDEAKTQVAVQNEPGPTAETTQPPVPEETKAN
jgi:hypothetical protein